MAKKESSGVNESLALKPSELALVLEAFYTQRKPKPIILGSPGCGKTALIYQTFREKLHLPVFVFQATLYDPTEIKGLPIFDHEKNIARFLPFEDMPNQKEGILFIDDLPHAPTQTQNAFMRIILEGVAGAWNIGGLFPIAAGNRAMDRAGAKDLQTAMANRFCFLNFAIDYPEWRKWAVVHDLSPQVIAYLGTPYGAEWLDKFDAGRQINPTPRSWEFASDCFKVLKGSNLRTALYGCIGEEATSKLMGWMKFYDKMPDLQKIIGGKNIYPEEQDVMYATISGLVTVARSFDSGKQRIAVYQRLIDYSVSIPDKFIELGVLLAEDLLELDSETFQKCNCDKWADKYPDLLNF